MIEPRPRRPDTPVSHRVDASSLIGSSAAVERSESAGDGDQRKRYALLVIAALLFGITLLLPRPEGLSEPGHKALAIFVLCVFLWMTAPIPLMITSLLAIVLFPLTGALPAAQAYAVFGNEAAFFILGAFVLASGLMRSGLSTRIALLFLVRFGGSPRKLLLGVMLIPAALSFVMSEHAVGAIMFPIVAEIILALRLSGRERRFGKHMILAMAWGCVLGGIATVLGGARAALAIGILQETTGMSIGFGEWALAAAPISIVLITVAPLLLRAFFPVDDIDVTPASTRLASRIAKLGRMSLREKGLLAVMSVTIASWMIFGSQIGFGSIAIAAVVVAFAFQLLHWHEVNADVNWGVFLMYGGAIALGKSIETTGVAHWFMERLFSPETAGPIWVLVGLAAASLILTQLISNTAVVALLMPVAIGIAHEMGLDPRTLTLALAIPSGLGLLFPIGTPVMAIALSSGYVNLRDMFRCGLPLMMIAIVVMSGVAALLWPLVGLPL